MPWIGMMNDVPLNQGMDFLLIMGMPNRYSRTGMEWMGLECATQRDGFGGPLVSLVMFQVIIQAKPQLFLVHAKVCLTTTIPGLAWIGLCHEKGWVVLRIKGMGCFAPRCPGVGWGGVEGHWYYCCMPK